MSKASYSFEINNDVIRVIPSDEKDVDYFISKIEKEIDGKFEEIEKQKDKELNLSKLRKCNSEDIIKINNGDIIKIYLNRKRKNVKTYYIQYKNKNDIKQSSKYPKIQSGHAEPFESIEFRRMYKSMSEVCFNKLMDFYVIKNPSIDSKSKSTTAQFFNIKETWGKDCWQNKEGSLKRRLMGTIEGYKHRVYHKKNAEDMKEIIEIQNLVDVNKLPSHNVFCFVDSCNNLFNSIFRHIRNSLAHGRFILYEVDNTEYLFFEDVNQEKVTARMVMKIETLLQWISIITDEEV